MPYCCIQVARALLEPIKAKFPWITYADLWTLAGATAVEAMGGEWAAVVPLFDTVAVVCGETTASAVLAWPCHAFLAVPIAIMWCISCNVCLILHHVEPKNGA